MHRNRTPEGLKKEREKQTRFENMLMGKQVDSSSVINGIQCMGEINKVEYIGNSTYGFVKIYLNNGCEFFVAHPNGFLPTKEIFRAHGIKI